MDTMKEFSERLQSAIDASGLSVRQTHERIIRAGGSVTVGTLYNWLDGRGQPQADMVRILADVLGCDVEALVGRPARA